MTKQDITESTAMAQVATAEPQMMPADPMVSMIERVAMDPQSDLAKLERMLELKEKHDAQNAKAAFDSAFAKASANFPEIPLNGHNKHNNTHYALLKDIIKQTRPVLAEHGLALSFSTTTTEKEVVVTAELSHENGHTKLNSLPLPRDAGAGRNAVQAIGSSQTYGQRYTAQAILGLSLGEAEEDDGASAGKPAEAAPQKQYSWAGTITADMPEGSTPREKAEAIAAALCAQFRRMKGERQMSNEWDRRASLIAELENKHNDLWGNVIDAYENRLNDIREASS